MTAVASDRGQQEYGGRATGRRNTPEYLAAIAAAIAAAHTSRRPVPERVGEPGNRRHSQRAKQRQTRVRRRDRPVRDQGWRQRRQSATQGGRRQPVSPPQPPGDGDHERNADEDRVQESRLCESAAARPSALPTDASKARTTYCSESSAPEERYRSATPVTAQSPWLRNSDRDAHREQTEWTG